MQHHRAALSFNFNARWVLWRCFYVNKIFKQSGQSIFKLTAPGCGCTDARTRFASTDVIEGDCIKVVSCTAVEIFKGVGRCPTIHSSLAPVGAFRLPVKDKTWRKWREAKLEPQVFRYGVTVLRISDEVFPPFRETGKSPIYSRYEVTIFWRSYFLVHIRILPLGYANV